MVSCTVEYINLLASGGVVIASGQVMYHKKINYVAQHGEVELFTGKSVLIKTEHDEQMASWEFAYEEDRYDDQKDENYNCSITAGPYKTEKRF